MTSEQQVPEWASQIAGEGHTLVDDPPAGVTDLERWTCTTCHRAVLHGTFNGSVQTWGAARFPCGEPLPETQWCPTCRRHREVVERSDESYYAGTHEMGYHAVRFACGHEDQSDPRPIGASPGGGEHIPGVARSTRPADLRAAREEQVRITRRNEQ